MEVRINWTPEAVVSFDEIFVFLLNQWNLKVAKAFATLVDEKIADVFIAPSSFPFYDAERNIRRILVHPHVTMFYKFLEAENSIHIILFWDNRQNPNERII